MSETTYKKLETYRKKQKLSYSALSRRLDVYCHYLFRWRKAGRIIGIYERVIEDFLKKEQDNGRF